MSSKLSSSFIFSLDERKKYTNNKRIPCEISCSEDSFAFASDLIIKQSELSIFNLNYLCNGDCDTLVETKFEIAELEVYKVE